MIQAGNCYGKQPERSVGGFFLAEAGVLRSGSFQRRYLDDSSARMILH